MKEKLECGVDGVVEWNSLLASSYMRNGLIFSYENYNMELVLFYYHKLH